ncbi:hypothetical protein [Streptomyces sp. NRRL F-5123]|uniref:hypothetical protein n=1 Tax=Streptomyces sp. NRRL F-5123 TaxID=1463856 RepID=UPI0006941163|nr:hypothetical protein [Streptomyces sp. NRRL F-5123]
MDNHPVPYGGPDEAESCPGPPEPRRRAPGPYGPAPLISTLVTFPLAALVRLYAAMSAMSGDPLDGPEAEAFDRSFTHGFHLLQTALCAAAAVLLTSWLLPPRERLRPARALLALAAPVLVVTGFLVFRGTVDWPR